MAKIMKINSFDIIYLIIPSDNTITPTMSKHIQTHLYVKSNQTDLTTMITHPSLNTKYSHYHPPIPSFHTFKQTQILSNF
jgi:hypothetical protein